MSGVTPGFPRRPKQPRSRCLSLERHDGEGVVGAVVPGALVVRCAWVQPTRGKRWCGRRALHRCGGGSGESDGRRTDGRSILWEVSHGVNEDHQEELRMYVCTYMCVPLYERAVVESTTGTMVYVYSLVIR